MAVSIVEVLARHGKIVQDELAIAFARRYAWDDRRGYGGTAHGILRALGAGEHWSTVAPAVFGGMGSMGNGGAMRAAPLGVYLAEDAREVVCQATLSAEVTHAHLEGQAGAVAVALAAAFIAVNPPSQSADYGSSLFEFVLQHTPDSQTRALVAQARDLPATYSVATAAAVLGNGSQVTAPDTVPFCLWCVARTPASFEDALWTCVSAGGDMDTTCAIVGGIIAACEAGAPPADWIARRELLPKPLG
jgi:ADP-ribosylglycohydrolase